MKRREFIALTGGAAAWPLVGRAQQRSRMQRVGILVSGPETQESLFRVEKLSQELQRLGWTKDRNVEIDILWGASNREKIADHVRTFARTRPDVILATSTSGLTALMDQIRDIPIIFVGVSDPLGRGVVDSISRPSGNVTGFSNFEFSLAGKWLQLIKEIAPNVTRVAMLLSTNNGIATDWFRTFKAIAPTFSVEAANIRVASEADIASSLESFTREQNGGLIVPGDVFLEAPAVRRILVDLAASRKLPAIYAHPGFPADGGLMYYGVDQTDQYLRAASYLDRVLRGAKPSDMPVQAPIRFESVINLKSAKALGLTVPATLLAIADEVIE